MLSPAMSLEKNETRVRQVLRPWESKVGGVPVARLLPARELASIGPVVFLDRFGPEFMEPGGGMQVGPHPHAGLATVTYPFQGELEHRDSLGNEQLIAPGEINWMTAGRGITHSERSPRDVVENGGVIDGVQLWCALPADLEQCEPRFEHRDAEELPSTEGEGWFARVLTGRGLGLEAPTRTDAELFLADVTMAAGAGFEFDACCAERAVLAAERDCIVDGLTLPEGHLAILEPGHVIPIGAEHGARVLLIGGPPLDSPRLVRGNFVATSKDRMVELMRALEAGRFPPVTHDPGDPS